MRIETMGSLVHTESGQPRSYRKRARFPLPASIVLIVCVVLYVQLAILPRFLSAPSEKALKLSQFHLERLDAGLAKCTELHRKPLVYDTQSSRSNPRWNSVTGQKKPVILRNATLFDGKTYVKAVDITFEKGVVTSVTPSSSAARAYDTKEFEVMDLGGQYVTPGLVDMHSHHLVGSWPALSVSEDTNEMNPATGPLTPFVRSLDSMKADDLATAIIASGGITSSLILPGSANIMGGEAFPVKNILRSGEHSEEVIEDLLLEHGIPKADRRRYMKMACGENPKDVYDHTRMGNAWIFRHHMERAKELVEKQDSWCMSAAAARESGDASLIASLVSSSSSDKGGLPEELELDSSVAMIRGKIGVNIHCYEPEDFEDMLLHSKEFGFRVQAFHHALSAWKVPELIKDSGDNITIATFSTFGLYKKEAYDANLWAGKILADHGVPVAYKSDHGEQELSAKYLLYQAATAHSFHLNEDLALQSVTSVPAKSLELDHRIGYVRAGYDADIVIWDSNPLSIGATPLQVYIDGRATLDPAKVTESLAKVEQKVSESPRMKPRMEAGARTEACSQLEQGQTIITGISRSYLRGHAASTASGNLTMVISGGKMICLGPEQECITPNVRDNVIALENGHVLPGLTAVTRTLGLTEIPLSDESGDGLINKKTDVKDPDNVVYAKYGVHLEGKLFDRAKIGGITRAVTAPMADGFAGGVSAGFKTSGKQTILNGGVFKDDVALHFVIGQDAKGSEQTPSVSAAIATLRKILTTNKDKDNVYGEAINGTIPLVVHVENKYDIMQLIKIKGDYRSLNLVLYGGGEATDVAKEIAFADIPIILTDARAAPDTWEKKGVLSGPPLTVSPVSVLSEAGVKFGMAIGGGEGDSFIHQLPLEASWAAKYAGLSNEAAIDLVSRNIEEILDLKVREETRDFVVWEGDPLQFGASVVAAVDAEVGIVSCWPETN